MSFWRLSNPLFFDATLLLSTIPLYHLLAWILGPKSRLLGDLEQARLLVAVFLVYDLGRAFSVASPGVALKNATRVLQLEQALSIDIEKVVQDIFKQQPAVFINAISVFYLIAHWASVVLFFGWMILRRKSLVHNRQFLFYLRSFLIANLVACCFFFLFPCAPPRMLEGFADTVREYTGVAVYESSRSYVNPFAAMPSMHFGYSFLFAHGVSSVASLPCRLKLLPYLYPAFMLLAIISTGNHFVLDAVCGYLVVCSAFAMVSKWWPPRVGDSDALLDLEGGIFGR